jgi:hypothetical protein
MRLETVPDNTPLPSHGKRRGPLPSPRRGEGGYTVTCSPNSSTFPGGILKKSVGSLAFR